MSKNITTNNFEITESKEELVHINEKMYVQTEGKFKFTNDTIRTIVIGSQFFHKKDSVVFVEHFNIITKLTLSTKELDGWDGRFTREEIIIICEFIRTRINHCEKERDSDKEFNGLNEIKPLKLSSFDLETFINMKLLLLDLREWLSSSYLTEIETKTKSEINKLHINQHKNNI